MSALAGKQTKTPQTEIVRSVEKELVCITGAWFASGGRIQWKTKPCCFLAHSGSLLLPISLIALTAGLKRNLILNTQNLKLFTIMFPKIALINRETANGRRFAPWLACHFWIHLFHTHWQNFTLPQELRSRLRHTNFELKKNETVKSSHRQTDRHTYTHFSTVRLCLGGIALSSVFLIARTQFVPVHWPPCLRVLEDPWAQCFWLSAPTRDNRALSLTPRWIVIHSKSIIRCFVPPFVFHQSAQRTVRK